MSLATAADEMRRHSFVFIGGMPQSGTSLLRRYTWGQNTACPQPHPYAAPSPHHHGPPRPRSLVASSPYVSGQDRCLGSTRCWETNIEGQWLVDSDLGWSDAERSTYLSVNVEGGRATVTHPLDERNVTAATGPTLLAHWERYWNLSAPILIEKSPPNLLR